MKKWAHSTDDSIPEINITALIDFYLDDIDHAVVASEKYPRLPGGELLPAEKDALIDSQVLADYHAFIETVEDMLTDYYGLEIYYKNDSPDHSFYFSMLARDKQGNVLCKFYFNLRVSNHDAHRSVESQRHKKESREALKKLTRRKKLDAITKSIIVNKDEFDNYEDAYFGVKQLVEGVVKTMKRHIKDHS